MTAAKHEVETTYINLWAETAYDLVVSSAMSHEMHRLGIDLVDVNYVLKTGSVVSSDMIDYRGLWVVHGATLDGGRLKLVIAVVSSECEVELLRIVDVRRS